MAGGGQTSEWTKTYTDVVGRSYQSVTAAGAVTQSFLNAQGQLVRSVDPDGVTSLFGYNARGEQDTQAIDMDRNGQIDFAGREHITRTVRTVASFDGPPADTKHFTIMPAVDVITEPRLAYLRLHGSDPKAYLTGKTVAERFHYDYSDDELGEVAERAQNLALESDEVHVVFNNNSRDFAPKAAERLRQRLGQATRRPMILKQTDLL